MRGEEHELGFKMRLDYAALHPPFPPVPWQSARSEKRRQELILKSAHQAWCRLWHSVPKSLVANIGTGYTHNHALKNGSLVKKKAENYCLKHQD